ncbi:helix-turn-helix domain-containing protein [Caballeronia sp. AZ10_KS36]|uniref:winged helix-turn-helix transcriptional regulator n=1 Tax=Caballeronia sp. AZ10_KS36 TaxID=2921757 RepID=UPI00202802E0|nr:helix-turn-helix domain-containing protein [Caballeronia sp. AZ10_KS36]
MRGQKTDVGSGLCPIGRSLAVVGEWWSLLIVRDALQGKQRFSEFQKSLGIAKNILSARLKKLVDCGVLRVETVSGSPSMSRYVLTDRGRELHVVLVALSQWGGDHCFEPTENRMCVTDQLGKPLPKLRVTNNEGHALHPEQVQIALATVPRRKQSAKRSEDHPSNTGEKS